VEGRRGRGRPNKKWLNMIEEAMRIAVVCVWKMWEIEPNGGLGQR